MDSLARIGGGGYVAATGTTADPAKETNRKLDRLIEIITPLGQGNGKLP